MKVSLSILSAAVALCVAHAAALAQHPGAPNPWRPDLSFPPNWQPGPGGAPFGRQGPLGPQGPVGPQGPGLNIPGFGSGYFGSESGPGSFPPLPGTTPPEPNVRAIIKQMEEANGAVPAPNPGGSAQISPAELEQILNQPKPDFSKMDFPKFEPARLPADAPARHEPPAAPPWQGWGWVAAAAGIFVLGLLARLLRDYVERKHTAR
jgi:hypothetical protein